MRKKISRLLKGFTIIEILVIIGIIAVLVSVVIAAINPRKQLADAQNVTRRSDVSTILNAVYQYVIDNQGTVPGSPAIDTNVRHICAGKQGTSCGVVANTAINLYVLTGSYLVDLPRDPNVVSGSAGTAYFITRSGNGRITVTAPHAENNATISASR